MYFHPTHFFLLSKKTVTCETYLRINILRKEIAISFSKNVKQVGPVDRCNEIYLMGDKFHTFIGQKMPSTTVLLLVLISSATNGVLTLTHFVPADEQLLQWLITNCSFMSHNRPVEDVSQSVPLLFFFRPYTFIELSEFNQM